MLTIRFVRVCICTPILLVLLSAAVFCQGNGAADTISVEDPRDVTGQTRVELPMVTPQEADRLRLLQQYCEARAIVLEEIATAVRLDADLKRLRKKRDDQGEEALTDAEKALLAAGLTDRQKWIVSSLEAQYYSHLSEGQSLADVADWLTEQWLELRNNWTQAMWDSNKRLHAGGCSYADGSTDLPDIDVTPTDPNASDSLKRVSRESMVTHEMTHYDQYTALATELNGPGWFDSYVNEHTVRTVRIEELQEDLNDPNNDEKRKTEIREEIQRLQREIDDWLNEEDGKGKTNREKLEEYMQWIDDNYTYAVRARDEVGAYRNEAEFLRRYLAQLDAARRAQAAQAPPAGPAQAPPAGPTSAPIGGNQPHRAEGPPAAQEHAAVAGIPEDIREAAEELGRATGLEAPGEGWTWPPPWCPGTSVQAVICDAQTWADSSDPKATPALKAKARSLVAYLRTASNENAQEVARLYIQAFHRGYQEAS